MTLSGFYQQQKRWVEAEHEFESVISLAPKNPMPHAALAGIYVRQGQDSLAKKTLTETKQQIRDNPAGRLLGDYDLSRGENAKALTEFGALLAEHRGDLTVRAIAMGSDAYGIAAGTSLEKVLSLLLESTAVIT